MNICVPQSLFHLTETELFSVPKAHWLGYFSRPASLRDPLICLPRSGGVGTDHTQVFMWFLGDRIQVFVMR